MKEAIGGSMLLYIVVFIVSVVMLLFVGILSYSKAYKVKNRIINVIEKYEDFSSLAQQEIEDDLVNLGYTSLNLSESDCDGYEMINNSYCIKEICLDEMKDPVTKETICKSGKYYKVKTFMTFNFPVINSFMKTDVKGETKIFGKNYNYE